MKLNRKPDKLYTHEGAVASHINPELQLRRSVMSCLLWEKTFYEEGEGIIDRIVEIIPLVTPEKVASIAIEAREQMKLRHVPLLVVREMARLKTHKHLVSDVLEKIIQRPDELTEFLAIYWKDKRQPLSAQVKKGLARAFNKFNEYQLAKYNRKEKIKLKDVLFLSHAKPKNIEQEELWKKLIDDKLVAPDTWEVFLSSGKDKKETFTRLIKENKLGGLAFLRNLRNMEECGVDENTILKGLESIKTERILPFRFITAAKHAPQWENKIEEVMLKCLEDKERLKGKTVVILDVSGSMRASLSNKSELTRIDAAAALALLVREICEDVKIYATAGNDRIRIHATKLLPARHGFALRDAFLSAERELGGGGIFLKQVMDYTYEKESGYADRIIVFTDEQDCDQKCNPASAIIYSNKNYLINISSDKNGIGYGKWIHIDGWSESIIDYIQTFEKDL